MADTLTQKERSARMSLICGKDTRPELIVRSMVHRLGYRFRLHRRDLQGKPDIVLPRHHAVIFVHGCFWHQHPDPSCRLARQPKTRIDFWQAKFEANQSRDLRAISALEADGWRVLVVWQCELRDKEQLENKLREFLADR